MGNRRSGIPKGHTGLCYSGIWEEELAGTACAGALRHVLVEQSLVINSAVVLTFLGVDSNLTSLKQFHILI